MYYIFSPQPYFLEVVGEDLGRIQLRAVIRENGACSHCLRFFDAAFPSDHQDYFSDHFHNNLLYSYHGRDDVRDRIIKYCSMGTRF